MDCFHCIIFSFFSLSVYTDNYTTHSYIHAHRHTYRRTHPHTHTCTHTHTIPISLPASSPFNPKGTNSHTHVSSSSTFSFRVCNRKNCVSIFINVIFILFVSQYPSHISENEVRRGSKKIIGTLYFYFICL